jgi:hypothetical protein
VANLWKAATVRDSPLAATSSGEGVLIPGEQQAVGGRAGAHLQHGSDTCPNPAMMNVPPRPLLPKP